MMHDEEALVFVMQFYHVTREVALELYADEVQAYKRLMNRLVADDPPST